MCLIKRGLVQRNKRVLQKWEKAASFSEGEQECKICLK